MIRRLHTVLVEHSVPSSLDQRKKIDRHVVAYVCPPDTIYDHDHEWLVSFEVKRGRIFDPPPKFKDKWEAHQMAQEIIR